jgi:formate hydrogenlyase subunit 3/multisubunit Na+/H+ antiporter MnhD subunit
MRGINFLAGLGTIFIFIGIFFFKALFYKKAFKEQTEIYTPVKKSRKVPVILIGIVCVALGLALILKAMKVI